MYVYIIMYRPVIMRVERLCCSLNVSAVDFSFKDKGLNLTFSNGGALNGLLPFILPTLSSCLSFFLP